MHEALLQKEKNKLDVCPCSKTDLVDLLLLQLSLLSILRTDASSIALKAFLNTFKDMQLLTNISH